jgi:SAM-dependent methyltransferase
MTDTVTSYDQVPYLFTSFPESHPRRLHAVAHLLGLETPPPAECRVLELGCAVGGNIVPMGYSLPKANLIGIDLVASQIETAKKFADGAGVKNVDLRAASITDVNPSWGKFDYIITHGVFSWIPHDVGEKVLQICHEQLTPNGIGYISFNTYPGWHVRMWAREAMLFHVEKIEDPIQRARAARDFILALAQSPFASGDKSALLKGEVQYLQGKPESYILHEYLETMNHPFYFRDFAQRIAGHGLQYLGDSLQNGMVAEEHWGPFKSWVEANRDDLVRLEQYADFVRNRMFRRALVCHADRTIDRKPFAERAESMRAVAFLRQWAEGNGMSRFEHPRGGRLVTGPGPLRDALITISRRFPHAIPFKEVIDAGGASRGVLARELLNCWMNGMLELYLEPPATLIEPGERPRASTIARYLAAQNQAPINQRHESIPVDPTQRRLIGLLDGTRTREQLTTDLAVPRENVDKLIQLLTGVALLEA